MRWRPRKRDAIREPFGGRTESDVGRCARGFAPRPRPELGGGEATAIFCSEHCHSRLTTADEVETLRDFLGGFFNDVQVIDLPAAPGPGGAQPLLDPAEERRHRPGDPAADWRRRSLLQLRPLAGALGGDASARECPRPPLRPRAARRRRRRQRLRRGLGPRRARALRPGPGPERVRSARWLRSSCAG